MLNCKTTRPASKPMDRSMKYSVCTKYCCFLSDAVCFEDKSSRCQRDLKAGLHVRRSPSRCRICVSLVEQEQSENMNQACFCSNSDSIFMKTGLW